MLNALRIAAVLAFVAVMPSGHAADVSGTWKGSFDFQGNSVPVTFHLKAAGDVITGTVEGMPASAEIHDGKVDGDTVTFWANSEYQGNTYKVVYKGKVSDGQIEFSLGTEDGSWGTTLVAKNDVAAPSTASATPNLTGDWKGSFDFEGGPVPLTFHLKAADGAVIGTVEGLPSGSAEIHDGKIEGDQVTFWLNTEYQGTAYKVVYKGTISPNSIKFSFGTEDGGWGAELTATKV